MRLLASITLLLTLSALVENAYAAEGVGQAMAFFMGRILLAACIGATLKLFLILRFYRWTLPVTFVTIPVVGVCEVFLALFSYTLPLNLFLGSEILKTHGKLLVPLVGITSVILANWIFHWVVFRVPGERARISGKRTVLLFTLGLAVLYPLMMMLLVYPIAGGMQGR